MQLMYLSSREDLKQLATYTSRHTRHSWRAHLRIVVLGSILPVLYAVLCWFIYPPLPALLFGSLVVIGWPLFYFWRAEMKYRHMLEQQYRDVYVGAHTLLLDDDGLTEQTQIGEGRCTWQQIRQIVRYPPYTYVYIADSNLIIIPHHRICVGDAAAFTQELEHRYATCSTIQQRNF